MNRRSFLDKFRLVCLSSSLSFAFAACSQSQSLKKQSQNLPTPLASKAIRPDGYISVGKIKDLRTQGAIASNGGVASPVDGLNTIIVKNPQDPKTPFAINPKCTHQGCVVEWHGDKNIFICPCHGAEFDASGTVVRGPASKSLQTYAVKVEEDSIFIKAS